jgi:hypothetical protein
MENQKWSWQELSGLIPIAASAFAFAFMVGYFSAFDIAWFPFFSLSEHLVFALRALPIAVGASVGLLIALEIPQTADESNFFSRHSRLLAWLWAIILAAAGAGMLLLNHLGLALSAWLIAVGVVFFEIRGRAQNRIGNMLLLVANMMAASMMIGFLSGMTWQFPRYLAFLDFVGTSRAITMTAPHPYVGHILFAGSDNVLFYDCRTAITHLLKRTDIKDLSEAPLRRTEACKQ